jgi:hypothetical protein
MKIKRSLFRHRPLCAFFVLATGLTSLCALPLADAAVTAVTFSFDSTLTGTGPLYLTASDVTSDPLLGAEFGVLGYADALDNLVFGGEQPENGQVFQNSVIVGGVGVLNFLGEGVVFGTDYTGGLGLGFLVSTLDSRLNSDSNSGYIGFQTSTGYWGFMQVTWDQPNHIFTIDAAYVESVQGNSITTFETVPEPSVAGLVAAGALAVIRRRRKYWTWGETSQEMP